MSAKTLNLKRVFVYSIYNHLRNTPPKSYPTTGEIKETISTVLPALREHVNLYAELLTRAESLSVKVAAKELTEEESKKQIEAINVEWREYNGSHGQEVCAVSLSDEGFKTLRGQFEREGWGSTWTANLDEYAEMTEAFSKAGK